MVREAECVSAETAADKMASQIENLDKQYRQACERAARTRMIQDNELVEDLRQRILEASLQFQALNSPTNLGN